MKLREFLQTILPTEVDFVFLPSDLAELEVVVMYMDSDNGETESDVVQVERNWPNKKLVISA